VKFAATLSSLLKSGSTLIVQILTKPAPPQSKHLPIVLRPLRNREVAKHLVLTNPLPRHAAHVESYFFTIRGTCLCK